jgi:general secretion pathway protein K
LGFLSQALRELTGMANAALDNESTMPVSPIPTFPRQRGKGQTNRRASFVLKMRPKNERGIALVIVLWSVLLLTVIAGNFVFAMRTETLVARNAVSAAQAEAVANGAVHRALYETYKPAANADTWKTDGRERQWERNGAKIRVVMMDESGKIDINAGSDDLLRGLLLSVGVDAEKSEQMLDAILDWRDADTLPRPKGAESEAYRASGLKYEPANVPFDAVEQLQQVLGMPHDIYLRVAPLTTVHSRQPGINTLVAPRAVLMAIPGADPAQVDAYFEQRRQSLADGQTPPPFPAGAAFTSAAINSVINVRAEARMADGAVFVREAVAHRSGEAKRPVAFLAWKEGRPAPAAEVR